MIDSFQSFFFNYSIGQLNILAKINHSVIQSFNN